MTRLIYTFYSHYNTDWIANMEIVLDPYNSVKKRLWCISHFKQMSLSLCFESTVNSSNVWGISDLATLPWQAAQRQITSTK